MEKINSFLSQFKTYWKSPRENNYVAYKEISAFSVGAMGVKSITSLLGYMGLSSTCLLIASVYGLSPRNIMLLYIITNIIGVLKTPFVSWLVDNTNTKRGKFRPYILWAGIPTLLAIIGLTWCIPIDAPARTKVILIGILFNISSIAQPLYNNALVGVSQVITPNADERTGILTVSEFLGNLGPSIVQFLLPTLAGVFFGSDGMIDIRTYRIFFPIIGVISFSLSLLVMTSTKERVIKPTNVKSEKISIALGLKYIFKNRYFWIVTIAKFFDGFKGGLTMLLPWICAYQLANSSAQGIIQTIVSVGYTPGIVLAPFFIKKLGTRNSAFTSNFLNCLTAIVMLLSFKRGIVFFVISLFLYNFALGPQYIMQTTILSNGFDHQQNRDGVRIEGFSQNFQLMITTIGGIVSTIVFTGIYERNGIVADPVTGLTDYSVLSDAAIRNPIISSIIITVIITSLFAALPYLLYNLTGKDMDKIRLELEEKKRVAEGKKD